MLLQTDESGSCRNTLNVEIKVAAIVIEPGEEVKRSKS